MKKLNWANRLTIMRVMLIPLFVVFLMLDDIPNNYLWALLTFVVASVTDAFDGFIARKFNMVTDLGKFLDPLADKILVVCALVCFVELGWIPLWTVLVIIAREFIVSGFRLGVVAKNNKAVIAADIWGKIKTAFTMVAIIGILGMWLLMQFDVIEMRYIAYFDNPLHSAPSRFVKTPPQYINLISDILMYICTALTAFSGFTMIWKNRKLFSE